MVLKQGVFDQHGILHQHFPGDCCLCRTESEIAALRSKLAAAEKRVAALEGVLQYTIKGAVQSIENRARGVVESIDAALMEEE
uniref:Uncharacterized protein n=1 Tax=viral metagenome TaxID=1070528 RepID=A0A6H1ZER4_9ZZZZ